MMNNFPNKDILHKFLNDELNANEIAMVISSIKQNEPYDEFSAGIKKYLEDHGYDHKSIIYWSKGAKHRIKQKLASTNNKQFSFWSKIAAILILCLSVYWFYQSNFNDSDKWKECYATEPGFPVLMSAWNAHVWMQKYRAAEYEKALEVINENLESNHLNDTLLFYKLVCQFETSGLVPEASYDLPKSLYYFENSKKALETLEKPN